MAQRSLHEWLAYLETLHPKSIAMGLARVSEVYDRLALSFDVPVVTVTGTNGKGSTCTLMEAMLGAAGYRVGLYTSPHLTRYNERVRIAGDDVDDATLVGAFEAVERARTASAPATPLTYFEFGTLAALLLFARARLDAWILEVGLGGRLDAVNLVDADVAVITNVDLDHQDYLGDTREAIGGEKAGILRAARPAVIGERDPPHSVVAHAAALGAPLYRLGHEFSFVDEGTQWRYRGPAGERFGLPVPALRGRYQLVNAATALTAVELLRARLPLDAGAIRAGLAGATLRGRFQVVPGRPTIVLDVAHNPHAARRLAATLGDMAYHPRTIAVFGMLRDKDIDGVIAALAPRVDQWRVATLPGPRGAGAEDLERRLRAQGIEAGAVGAFDDVQAALAAARGEADQADRIVVFGSFLTVAAALTALSR